MIASNHGLKLRALVDFEDEGEKRIAGDEWQLKGPLTYHPKAEVVSLQLYCHFHSKLYSVVQRIPQIILFLSEIVDRKCQFYQCF